MEGGRGKGAGAGPRCCRQVMEEGEGQGGKGTWSGQERGRSRFAVPAYNCGALTGTGTSSLGGVYARTRAGGGHERGETGFGLHSVPAALPSSPAPWRVGEGQGQGLAAVIPTALPSCPAPVLLICSIPFSSPSPPTLTHLRDAWVAVDLNQGLLPRPCLADLHPPFPPPFPPSGDAWVAVGNSQDLIGISERMSSVRLGRTD